MSYSAEKLRPFINALPSINTLYVAYSGGCDSQVLLYSLSVLKLPCIQIKAIHIDHGLQAASPQWAASCKAWAKELGFDCQVIRVDAQAQTGESPEQAARQARYQALANVISKGDVLLTAHHCDDQAETVMLQLLRGSGPLGLSAMGRTVPFSDGLLGRPLLEFTRADLEDYGRSQGLKWIDDPSNLLLDYDRNFIRHRVSPLFAERWPSWQYVLNRVAFHQAEITKLADDLAAADFSQVADESGTCLKVSGLLQLADYRRRNVLRFWIRQRGLLLPSTRQLSHIEKDVLKAGKDRTPLVHWSNGEVRRYRDYLYAMSPLVNFDAKFSVHWDTSQHDAIELPTGRLTLSQLREAGLSFVHLDGASIEVRYRQGGEKIRIKGKNFHQDLKSLFQEAGVPPWLRGRIPLVYQNDKLLLVVGYWLADNGK